MSSLYIFIELLFWYLIFFLYSQAKDRTCRLVQSGVENGARLILDGRNIVVYLCFLNLLKYELFDDTKLCLTYAL